MADVVSLNVGGTIYTTSRATLTRFPDSRLGSMFSDRLPSIKDDKGNYLIDGDGSLFRYVLNFLRRSILVLPEDFKELDMLAQEADYYQIKELNDAVTQIRNKVTIDREEEKRAKERVKKQEFLESILVLPEDFKELDMLAQEADYYQIKELIDAVTRIRNKVTVDKAEEKRAKELVKKQEFLEN
ncbi:BTB/POZ domain-containing protein KCTD6-like [Strongylocentrotus purpuratus]|uniref:BTB domain-containing protein n=1 Tax=Strongylocentrotus purpuratus TaxID=7668 RepID=A0A7M7T4G0_STRPU|nr:BTB/POZ domain-containing protein KCTD6-like [Strongylocentrotus purpuratus]